jgi:hypothetical protein
MNTTSQFNFGGGGFTQASNLQSSGGIFKSGQPIFNQGGTILTQGQQLGI